MSSAEYSCKLQIYFCTQANSVDLLKEQSDLGPHCSQK